MNSTAYLTHRSNLSRSTAAASRSRAGYAMVEVILAFAVFGIALAGLFPFMVTQLKLTTKLETRFQGKVDASDYMDVTRQNSHHVYPNSRYPLVDHYAIPWNNPRMRSLLGGVVITTDPHDPDELTPYQLLLFSQNSAVVTRNQKYQGVDYLPPTNEIDDYLLSPTDDYTTSKLKEKKLSRYPLTIHSVTFDYPDLKSDPTITVILDLNPDVP